MFETASVDTFDCALLQDAKVMSWWDYGYQITAMANRTILVDNNTWNNTHISRVGQVSRQADVGVIILCVYANSWFS